MKIIRSMAVGIAMVSIVGCTNMNREEQGTLSGAAIGAAAGAGIAAIAGGSGWTGAAIGGVAWIYAGWPACVAMIAAMLTIMGAIVTLTWRTAQPKA